MKIHPVGAELMHAEIETDGQTDMTQPIVAFHNFAGVLPHGASPGTNVIVCFISAHIKSSKINPHAL
jgi:hypothetical protein